MTAESADGSLYEVFREILDSRAPSRQDLSVGRSLDPGLDRHALRPPQPGRHRPMALRL